MKDLFKGRDLLEFAAHFGSDNDCKIYLSDFKWEKGYSCKKCSNSTFQIRSDFSRTCNKCSHTESATANTLFHKVKFGLRKAFFICFEMGTSTKSLSASYVAVRFTVTEKTARLFMHKVREAMKSSENHPMDGNVEVDEFVVGGKEESKVGRSYDVKKKKAICAVEYTDDMKIKRMYIKQIDDYSSKELKTIFTKHISTDAVVTTDKWRGYAPLKEEFKIIQEESNSGLNFKKLHTMIHQVKSWIRTTYSWVSKDHIDRYFNEFCYRLNRSQSKDTIFNNLIKRMVSEDKLYHRNLICS
jgi:transposase-like protein